jgi:hypothetical protein
MHGVKKNKKEADNQTDKQENKSDIKCRHQKEDQEFLEK